jgi:hypothetical protein
MSKRLAVAALLSAVVTLVGAPAQASSDFPCVGAVVGGVYENVIVPEGAFCDISNAQIRGNIKALRNSTLFASGGNTVGGNVEGDKADDVEIFTGFGLLPNVIHGNGVIVEDSLVTIVCGALLPSGDITVVKNRGTLLVIGRANCAGGGNTVERGNIKVEDSVISNFFEVSDNRVGQNLQVYKNTSTTMTVTDNTAGESVQCFDNDGALIGGPNTAPKREGQCY